jgi:hypothetical protein
LGVSLKKKQGMNRMRLLNKQLAIGAVALGALASARSSVADFAAGSEVVGTGFSFTVNGGLSLTLALPPASGTNLTVVSNPGLPVVSGSFQCGPRGGTLPLSFNGDTAGSIANYQSGNGASLVLQWPCMEFALGWNWDRQLGNSSATGKWAPVAVTASEAPAGKTVVGHCTGLAQHPAVIFNRPGFCMGAR